MTLTERIARRLIELEEGDPDGPTTIDDRPARWMLMIEDAQSILALIREPTEAMTGNAKRLVEQPRFTHYDAAFIWRSMIDAELPR